MIESVKINNFQSLQDVEIEFGRLTVIVGPSSSGKSAIIRALKAVVSNDLHSDYITRGTKYSSVSVNTGDTVVTIERELGGSSVYKIAQTCSKESRFARINRQVPAEVTEALGILPSTKEVESIHFAGQFDTPYLLTETSSNVARILGELTNVSTIFAAVKEASRRAKASSRIVNIRKEDQAKLLSKLTEYSDLAVQSQLLKSLEADYADCTKIEVEVSQLQDLLSRADMAVSALQSIKEIKELPSLDEVLKDQKDLNEFTDLLRTWGLNKKLLDAQDANYEQAQIEISTAEEELHNLLVSVGKCPTCNQEIA